MQCLDNSRRFCRYCGDTEVRPDWQDIGGTIGEVHYCCHRKRCQKLHEANRERTRRYLADQRAGKVR